MKTLLKKWHQQLLYGVKRLTLPMGIRTGNGILLTGSPRSGTTWLGALFRRLPQVAVIFEPLHCLEVPAARQAGFKMRTFKYRDDYWPEGAGYLVKCLSGKGLNQWGVTDVSVKEAVRARAVILKCVRANRLLPWFCQQLRPIRTPLLVVRHPCAVVASQLRQGSWDNPSPVSLEEIPDGYEFLKPLVDLQKTSVEILAVRWAVDNAIPVWSDCPQGWMTVFYEDLQEDFERVMTALLSEWGFGEIPARMLQERGRPSRMTSAGIVRGVSGWKTDLSDDQVRSIMKICKVARLDFYTDEGKLRHESIPAGVRPVGVAASTKLV